MNDKMRALFVDNPELQKHIREFCLQDPEYVKRRREFYEAAHEVAEIVGYDLYERFEERFSLYMARSYDIYYLFGLGLRQDIISALQPEIS